MPLGKRKRGKVEGQRWLAAKFRSFVLQTSAKKILEGPNQLLQQREISDIRGGGGTRGKRGVVSSGGTRGKPEDRVLCFWGDRENSRKAETSKMKEGRERAPCGGEQKGLVKEATDEVSLSPRDTTVVGGENKKNPDVRSVITIPVGTKTGAQRLPTQT